MLLKDSSLNMGNALFPEVNDQISQMFPELTQADAPTIKATTTVYFVRHTTTDIDDASRSHGWLDEPLNDKGINQAIEVAKKFNNIKIDCLYCSDLQRARQTAYFIAGVTGVHPQPMPAMRPIDMGDYSGESEDKIDRELGSVFKKWQTDKTKEIPGGESFDSFEKRNLYGIQQIIFKESGKTVVIVGHSITSTLFDEMSKQGIVGPLGPQGIIMSAKHEDPPDIEKFTVKPDGSFNRES